LRLLGDTSHCRGTAAAVRANHAKVEGHEWLTCRLRCQWRRQWRRPGDPTHQQEPNTLHNQPLEACM
jgi:hypothetical protein